MTEQDTFIDDFGLSSSVKTVRVIDLDGDEIEITADDAGNKKLASIVLARIFREYSAYNEISINDAALAVIENREQFYKILRFLA